MKYRTSNSGFTLLEVMIAMTILAAISFSIFVVTSQTLSSKATTEDLDEFNHSITLALGKMAGDLNMAFMVNSKDLLGENFDGEYAFEGTEERVDFVSFSHSRFLKNSRETDIAEVSYYLEPMNDELGRKMLVRRESSQVDKNLKEGGETIPLLEGVESLKFEYLDQKSREYKKTWNSKSVDFSNQLPLAVRIQIEAFLPDSEEKNVFTIEVPIELYKGPINF